MSLALAVWITKHSGIHWNHWLVDNTSLPLQKTCFLIWKKRDSRLEYYSFVYSFVCLFVCSFSQCSILVDTFLKQKQKHWCMHLWHDAWNYFSWTSNKFFIKLQGDLEQRFTNFLASDHPSNNGNDLQLLNNLGWTTQHC